MKSQIEKRIEEIEAQINHLQPYAKLVATLGLDIVAKRHGNGINQGHVDRAVLFCELVTKREWLMNQVG